MSRIVMTLGAVVMVSRVAEATTLQLDLSSAEVTVRGQMICEAVPGAPSELFAFDGGSVEARLIPQTLTPGTGSYTAEVYDRQDRLVATATGTAALAKLGQTGFARVVITADSQLPVGTVSRDGGFLQVVVGPDSRFAAGHLVLTARGEIGVVVLQVSTDPGSDYVDIATCSGRGVAEISIPYAVFP
jgi:hypothetical protein